MFPVPPFAEDVFSIYKSGYFKELDRQFEVIADSFVGIKTMSRPAYAWVFLEDMREKHGIDIRVYNSRSERVKAPGEVTDDRDGIVVRLSSSSSPSIVTEIRGNRYYAAIPMTAHARCRFCHTQQEHALIGTITFERTFDAIVFYGRERSVLFGIMALISALLLFSLIRWDPSKRIKEIFDK
jgi:hypothetical protein